MIPAPYRTASLATVRHIMGSTGLECDLLSELIDLQDETDPEERANRAEEIVSIAGKLRDQTDEGLS